MNTRRRPIAPSPNIYATNAKICQLVAKHPCLYDRSDDNYMRKSTVKNAWKDISKEMRNSVKSCKERWRNIRTSYARSIKVHHGANTYYLNNELQFLQNHITPGVPVPLRGRRSKPKGQEDVDQEDEEHETPVEAFLEMKQSPSSPDTDHAQSRESNESYSEDESEDEKGSWQGRAKKRLRLSREGKEEAKASIQNGDAVPVMDFDDAFLQGLRPEIKHMNFHQKLYFKRRVYELLSEIFHSEESASPGHPPHSQLPDKVNGTRCETPPPPSNPLQHLGLTLQLPKLAAKTAKDV
ncbi:transcription factor Adf-1 [Drosophila ficusphila]|uniref:transcription factor Adf-1 n=1 Tax=Drosophila ficusphila TaxID=30025 RepID=UPI0007E879BE|nr:transcription factor Adf-1 [Drosophila ficusphila]XP_017039458.1 transcription factor Adf-1 [Drosophila ficusphila]